MVIVYNHNLSQEKGPKGPRLEGIADKHTEDSDNLTQS